MVPLPHSSFAARGGDSSLTFPDRREVLNTASVSAKRDALIVFCYKAHSDLVDFARRQHSSPGALERLSIHPTSGGPSVLTLSDADREALLEAALPGYSKKFIDFIDFAKKIAGRLGQDGQQSTQESPEDLAEEIALRLILKITSASSTPHCQLTMALVSSLANSIQQVMPASSGEISDALHRALRSSAETPLAFR